MQPLHTAVEIGIWEGYLDRNKTHVGKTLYTYSLDNGPLNQTVDGNLVFRFTLFDWEKNIASLLLRNNIHFAELGQSDMNPLGQLLRKKIYVAEDDPDILFSLSAMLEDAGYQVRSSTCGAAVVNGNFSLVDLFILDKQMPDMDGLDVCRHLRSQSTTRDIPVILISAHPKCASDALKAGANDYIEKPFEMHYLLNVVSKYTRLRA